MKRTNIIKTIGIVSLLFIFTEAVSCPTHIYQKEFDRLSSLKKDSSIVQISDSNSVIFLHLVKKLIGEEITFNLNESRSIEMNDKEFSRLINILYEEREKIEQYIDSLTTILLLPNQFISLPDNSFLICAIHYLDNDIGKDVFDVESMCTSFFYNFSKRKPNNKGFYNLFSDDYLFLFVLLGIADNNFGWNIDEHIIHQKTLKNIEGWCIAFLKEENASGRFFERYCHVELNDYFPFDFDFF